MAIDDDGLKIWKSDPYYVNIKDVLRLNHVSKKSTKGKKIIAAHVSMILKNQFTYTPYLKQLLFDTRILKEFVNGYR